MAEQSKEGRISIQHASKIYDPEGVNVWALDDNDVEIEPGEFVMCVGPSGCGKTTLLNAIAGFDNLTGGEIYLDGQLIASPKMKQTPVLTGSSFFKMELFFLENGFAEPDLWPDDSRKDDKRRPSLKPGGLWRGWTLEAENLYPDNLSSGMKRQVEIIRALINNPKVLLLDEPFRALDSTTKGLMHEYLLGVFRLTRKTIFFITHDLEESIFLADRVLIMTTRPGRIKTVIKVDIPRPRDFRVLATDHFMDLKEQAVAAIREETLKAFEAGERELA
jgi:NitT/TauT family transport system ATP-binding protein